MPYTTTSLTLGQLLDSQDITIHRNAMSILKCLQRCEHQFERGACIYCLLPDIVEQAQASKPLTRPIRDEDIPF